MPGPTRKLRLESLLHREIATVIQRDLRDPRLGFLTVTRVEMSDDLQLVTAFYTVLGGDSQRRTVARALDDAVGYVERAYAPVVRTRLLPRLRFAYDDREAKRQDMDELIRRARSTDPDGGETPVSADLPAPAAIASAAVPPATPTPGDATIP